MSQAIRHAKSVSPWFVPNKAGNADDFHGVSNITRGVTQGKEDTFVIGKEAKCGTDKNIPEASVTVNQFERGQIATYLTLANLASEPGAGLTLADFSSSLVDVVLYEKDDYNGNLEQSIWIPKTALNSIEFAISDAEAKLTRKFELKGDTKRELNYGNKYLIHKKNTAGSGVSGTYVINVSDPVPVADPNNSGKYILRIDRTRSSVTTTLDYTTDFTYASGPQDITIVAGLTGDVYNIYYSAASFGTAGDPTTVDTSDPCFLKASYVTVTLNDGTTTVELDLITALTITATLNRIDEAVIGKNEKVLKEVETTTVAVSLTGRVKDSSIAEVFMNKAGLSHGISDVQLYNDNVTLTVKVYNDAAKTSFLIGYEVSGLSFDSDNTDFSANAFGTLQTNASSTDLLITTSIGNLTV